MKSLFKIALIGAAIGTVIALLEIAVNVILKNDSPLSDDATGKV